ncbi:MAG: FtsX-like permease family protein [Bacteroidota bacterium]
MFQNNIKLTFRNLFKNKVFTLISIAGLGISLTAVFLIVLWIKDEYQVNRFPEKLDRIYSLLEIDTLGDGTVSVDNTVPYPLIQESVEQIPGIEQTVALDYPNSRFFELEGQLYKSVGSYGAFEMFDFFSIPLLMGNVDNPKENINTIVLTESYAKKLYGDNWQERAIGSSLKVGVERQLEIVGICADPPKNASEYFDFEYIINLERRLKTDPWLYEWGNTALTGFMLLQEGTKPETVHAQFSNLYNKEDDIEGIGFTSQPFADRYLYNKFDEYGKVEGGRIDYIRIFGVAAVFLLLIACINFINLATARATKRAKEIGVRKTIGANKEALISQFMLEALVIVLLSVAAAVLLASMLLPALRQITEKEILFSYWDLSFWGMLLGGIVVTTLLSGLYPAFVLSAFKPVEVIKGQVVKNNSKFDFRKSLVVLQFVLSTLLVVFAFIVRQQVNYIQNKNLGLDRENVVYIQKDALLSSKFDVLRTSLLQKTGIVDVAATSHTPIDIQSSTNGIQWPGKQAADNNLSFDIQWADYNYVDIFKIPISEGRFYQKGMLSDSSGLVINRAAADVMGMEEATGQVVDFWDGKRQIIGVLENFHTRSLHEDITPMVVLLQPNTTWSMFIRTAPGATDNAISNIRASFAEVLPGYQLEYEFLDDKFKRRYKSEMITSQLANYFAFIAIFIGCLGLLGLATFMIQQRTKEIGIRKVLGASVTNLVGLLSKDFLGIVLIAVVIATPIAWYLSNQWLDSFAYKIDVEWWVFALTGILTLMIAFLTISFQSLKAAFSNPINALRNE